MDENEYPNSCNSSESMKLKAYKVQQFLEQSVLEIKDLMVDFERIQIETETYKAQLKEQKEKCESKSCSSAKTYKEMVAAKDLLIQHVASALTRLNETKNLSIINEVFQLLCGEPITTSSSKESLECGDMSPSFLSPKIEEHDSKEGLPRKDYTMSEIEGTPTGRFSPILTTRGVRLAMNASSPRDKKKCSDDWTNSENKIIKLLNTPQRDGKKKTGKTRQMRFSIIKGKRNNVIDLTCSPEARHVKSPQKPSLQLMKEKENEDTIPPSPTSGTSIALSNIKTTATETLPNFKKPLPSKSKSNSDNENKLNVISENVAGNDVTNMEASINNFNKAQRVPKHDVKQCTDTLHVKLEPDDVTYCEVDDSISVLRNVKLDFKENAGVPRVVRSPEKRPLVENINATNTENETVLQSSISLLRPHFKMDDLIRKAIKVNVEDNNIDSTVKKEQKYFLPGWTCNQCKNFYGELYKDDPGTLASRMAACARAHRGRAPPRARSPPGFWNPRWQVPDDTEEFNRMNNAI